MSEKSTMSSPLERPVGRHTPGPWRWGMVGPDTWELMHGTQRVLYNHGDATEFRHGLVVGEAMSHPDASLIAAAPDLLDIVSRLGCYLPNELQQQVDDVLAKALGVPPNYYSVPIWDVFHQPNMTCWASAVGNSVWKSWAFDDRAV